MNTTGKPWPVAPVIVGSWGDLEDSDDEQKAPDKKEGKNDGWTQVVPKRKKRDKRRRKHGRKPK